MTVAHSLTQPRRLFREQFEFEFERAAARLTVVLSPISQNGERPLLRSCDLCIFVVFLFAILNLLCWPRGQNLRLKMSEALPAAGSSKNIQVTVKVRPLIKREKADKLPKLWRVKENTIQLIDPPLASNEGYTFGKCVRLRLVFVGGNSCTMGFSGLFLNFHATHRSNIR